MRPRSLLFGLAALAAVTFVLPVLGQEAPDRGTSLYYLEIDVKQPRPIKATGIDGEEKVFWYLKYTVTNPTMREVYFCPRFAILTEEGNTYRDIIPAPAVQAIEKRVGREIEAGVQAADTIKAGGELTAYAIFPKIGDKADRLYLRIGGLTNEYYLDKTDKESKPVFKVYQIRYDRPGDPVNLAIDPVMKGREEWVWANEPVE